MADFLAISGRVSSLEVALGSSVKKFHESQPENAAPAFHGCQLRRRLKLSQKLCQIGQFSLSQGIKFFQNASFRPALSIFAKTHAKSRDFALVIAFGAGGRICGW